VDEARHDMAARGARCALEVLQEFREDKGRRDYIDSARIGEEIRGVYATCGRFDTSHNFALRKIMSATGEEVYVPSVFSMGYAMSRGMRSRVFDPVVTEKLAVIFFRGEDTGDRSSPAGALEELSREFCHGSVPQLFRFELPSLSQITLSFSKNKAAYRAAHKAKKTPQSVIVKKVGMHPSLKPLVLFVLNNHNPEQLHWLATGGLRGDKKKFEFLVKYVIQPGKVLAAHIGKGTADERNDDEKEATTTGQLGRLLKRVYEKKNEAYYCDGSGDNGDGSSDEEG